MLKDNSGLCANCKNPLSAHSETKTDKCLKQLSEQCFENEYFWRVVLTAFQEALTK